MAEGLKDYISECLREVPFAFRRGVVVVTIIANLILAIGLYLGWHLNAITPFQITTAAVVIAILEIILILPYRLWKVNKAEIAALKASSIPTPDWKIRELFYHIRPHDLIENDNWETVGADVLDRLASGQLLAWGRRHGDRPLQPITITFWPEARFTYFFLADDHDNESHAESCNISNLGFGFSDIRVNKGAALRIWPRLSLLNQPSL
jgi:hypothetical protein